MNHGVRDWHTTEGVWRFTYTVTEIHPMDMLVSRVSDLAAAVCDLERELKAAR